MSAERYVDPEVTQALERLQTELRAEQRELQALPEENARLRERLERLQAERDQLRGALEAVKQGLPANLPRLPEVLTPSFEVRSRGPLRRQVRDVVSMLLVGVLLLTLPAVLELWPSAFMYLFVVVLETWRHFKSWRDRPRWYFTESGIERGGREALQPDVAYARVLDAEAQASKPQRRRGVGTVRVKYRAQAGKPEEEVLVLQDVPEPERLAEWIRSKRSQGE